MGRWIVQQDWSGVLSALTAHEKAEILQGLLMTQLEKHLPQKTIRISCDDQPWFTNELKEMDRKRKREYFKNKKFQKWKKFDEAFKIKREYEKTNYSRNIVEDLKISNPKQWYSKVKWMLCMDQSKEN